MCICTSKLIYISCVCISLAGLVHLSANLHLRVTEKLEILQRSTTLLLVGNRKCHANSNCTFRFSAAEVTCTISFSIIFISEELLTKIFNQSFGRIREINMPPKPQLKTHHEVVKLSLLCCITCMKVSQKVIHLVSPLSHIEPTQRKQ